MKNTPLVSVAIPYYNDSAFLKESIESVLNQTYSNFEIILINHASTDGSREIARSYDDVRIKHIDLPENTGAGGGLLLKAFLSKATGTYTKLFCADDIMLPNCIETLLDFLLDHSDIDFVFSDMIYIDELKQKISLASEYRDGFDLNLSEDTILDNYIGGISNLPHPTVMLKTSIIKQEDLELTCIMRYDTFLYTKLLLRGCKVGILKDALVLYRVHDKQLAYCRNWDRAARRGFFESFMYYPLFFEIKDVMLVRYLCRNLKFIDKLCDVDLIPFVMAYFFFVSNILEQRIIGYIKLQQLLNNSQMSKKILCIFGFSVKEFRWLYSRLDNELGTQENQHICYSQRSCEDLGFVDLSKLLLDQLKKLFRIFSVKRLISKKFNIKKILNKPTKNLKFFEIIIVIVIKLFRKLRKLFKRHG